MFIITNYQVSLHIWKLTEKGNFTVIFLMCCQKNPTLTNWTFYQNFWLIFKFHLLEAATTCWSLYERREKF